MDVLLSRRGFMKRSVLGAALSVFPPGVKPASSQDLEHTDHPRKVIVVGAGMAGLAAGFQLVQAGHDVTLLEARAQAGGLVETLRAPFSEGLYADAGAMFIPENHDITLKYVERFDLPLKPFFPQGLTRVYYLQGKRFEAAEGQDPVWPLDLTPAERRLGLNGLRQQYVTSVLDELRDPTAPGWPPEGLKKYDDLSFGEFLRQRGASPAAVTLLTLGAWNQWGDGVDTVSALLVLRAAALRQFARQFSRIEGGNDRLPRAFASQLGERIHYQAPVVRIDHDPQGVRVVFQKSGRHQALAAEHLVFAIPFSTLRHIEISPPLSPRKREAIERLPYSSATRVFLEMRRKFWLDEGLSGWALSDLPISSVLDATANEIGGRGILATYMSGAAAREFAGVKEGERIERTLDQVERVFPGSRRSFERGASIAWDEIPWSRGAAPYLRPGQMTALLPHMGRAEGRLHFAGEHTSVWMRWMQGALESGHRAAREIQEAA